MDDKKCRHCGTDRERCWIDYPEDDNCIYKSIDKHGAMTLKQIAQRLGISIVRVSQLEKQALKKLSKAIKK